MFVLELVVRVVVRVGVRIRLRDAWGTKRLGTKRLGTKCLEAVCSYPTIHYLCYPRNWRSSIFSRFYYQLSTLVIYVLLKV